MKKLCIIYANCQGRGIDTFLQKSDTFLERYSIKIVENYSTIANNSRLPIDALQMAELFIYQPVEARHGIYSTDNVKKYLPCGCVTISFPYIYNGALWPLFEEGNKIKGKEPIISLIEEGLSLDKIVNRFCEGKIDFQFERRFRESIAILRSKEFTTDVKVADFIINNMRAKKLFLTQNHPTSALFIYCANQILTILRLPSLAGAEQIHPNEAGLPGCWPLSPYEWEYYGQEYLCDWEIYFKEKKDGNWLRFYLRIIGKIYLSYPMPWISKFLWRIYLCLRIKWNLLIGEGYFNRG